MAEESKQYTAFTLGSMGLFECDRMPFGLCKRSRDVSEAHAELSR